MAKIFFFLIFNFLFLTSCNVQNLKNSLSQSEPAASIYSSILAAKSKIIKIYDDSLEGFLLKFNNNYKDYWKIEDKKKRLTLPEFKTLEIESSPTVSNNKNEYTLDNWYRSHGNHSSNRFSELELINTKNVHNVEIDWIFKSGEPQSIQCNPIIIDGTIYTPISGNYIAAIDGSNGNLIWKSK